MTDAEFIKAKRDEAGIDGPYHKDYLRLLDIAARYIAMWEELRTRLECERGYLVENARKTRTRFYSGAYDWNNTVLRFMEMFEQKHSNTTEEE